MSRKLKNSAAAFCRTCRGVETRVTLSVLPIITPTVLATSPRSTACTKLGGSAAVELPPPRSSNADARPPLTAAVRMSTGATTMGRRRSERRTQRATDDALEIDSRHQCRTSFMGCLFVWERHHPTPVPCRFLPLNRMKPFSSRAKLETNGYRMVKKPVTERTLAKHKSLITC